MHISELNITGFKSFTGSFSIRFQPGLNVLVGENGSGKSSIIDSLRLLFSEEESSRVIISDTDFNRPFDTPTMVASSIQIVAKFTNLSSDEKVVFLPWTLEASEDALLTMRIENKQNRFGRFKKNVWGGASRSSMFESDLYEKISCVYLPPLRDATLKLKEGKGSKLARLIRILNKKELAESKKTNTIHPLVRKVQDFNSSLADDTDVIIITANDRIKEKLKEAIGPQFGQDTIIQFSETNFNRIVENLRLLFYPEQTPETPKDHFRSLEENSLGLNNILYLATILAEMTFPDDDPELYKILLIEEPEAHLHPQLQIRLLKYLESVANENKVQIIVSTHSTSLAASVNIDSIIHLSTNSKRNYLSVPLREVGLSKESRDFLHRWLDATKSTLLFAKGIILVEGISEAMLIPELAKIVLKRYNTTRNEGKPVLASSLEDAGISVINMNGIYFMHFMQVFCDLKDQQYIHIPIRCAGITDNDPPADTKPTASAPVQGSNPAIELVNKISTSKNCRLYVSKLKTFEYDLAMEANNLKTMARVARELITTDGSIQATYSNIEGKTYDQENEQEKAGDAFYLLEHIEKGLFAQSLADCILANPHTYLNVPEYISKAVIWACGGDDCDD